MLSRRITTDTVNFWVNIFGLLALMTTFKNICSSPGPEKGLIIQKLQISYKQCVDECEKRQKCVSAKYIRMTSLCVLYDYEYITNKEPSLTVYVKPSAIGSDENGQCGDDGHILHGDTESCCHPRQIPGTEIIGNMVSIGSKIKYVCLDGSGSDISRCFPNGSWSETSIRCNCSEPVKWNQNQSFLENVKKWTYQKINGQITALAACNNSTCSTGSPAICNSLTGMWTFPSNICCNPLACPNSDWTQFQDSCYHFLKISGNFSQGTTRCVGLSGHPVFIQTKEENEWLKKWLINLAAAEEFYFIGITNVDSSGCTTTGTWVFYNTTGTISFKDFDENDQTSSRECCAMMYRNLRYKWADGRCNAHASMICELELEPKTKETSVTMPVG